MRDIVEYNYKAHFHFTDYLITECGEVYSTLSNKFLSQKTRRDNYKEVVLRKDGKSFSCLVHRLVIEAHLGMPVEYNIHFTVCNHKDGNRGNNHINNLEWTTQKDNCSEDKSNQKQVNQDKRGHTISKCDEEGNVIKTYPSIREAARQNNAGDSTIARALKLGNKSKGYYWRYEDDFYKKG